MENKTMKEKGKSIKNWCSETAEKVGTRARLIAEWIHDNPVAAVTIATAAASCANKGYKAYKLYDENKRRNRMFYDPRAHRWSEAKRNLRWYENDEVDARYNNGESYHKILGDMRLLK